MRTSRLPISQPSRVSLKSPRSPCTTAAREGDLVDAESDACRQRRRNRSGRSSASARKTSNGSRGAPSGSRDEAVDVGLPGRQRRFQCGLRAELEVGAAGQFQRPLERPVDKINLFEVRARRIEL